MKIEDIIETLESFAPERLAYSWDNVGMQVGEKGAEIESILLALDLTPAVVDHAVKNHVDLIVTHHPHFITPLKSITDPVILKLVRNNIALYTMHTNLDMVREGVSTALADRFNLSSREFISHDTGVFHIALYVPATEAQKVAKAVHEAGAGIIGNYSHCLNSYTVDGQFKPLAGSNPAIGSRDEIEQIQEMKMEFFVDQPLLNNVKKAIHNSHPYETPVYSIYELHQNSLNYGLGITGILENPCTLHELALLAKERLAAPFVKLWLANDSSEKVVRKIAVCGGSGSSLIDKVAGKAEAFISADFTYHRILDSQIPLIDAGHFHTEYPVLEVIKKLLQPCKIAVEIFDINKADIERLICI